MKIHSAVVYRAILDFFGFVSFPNEKSQQLKRLTSSPGDVLFLLFRCWGCCWPGLDCCCCCWPIIPDGPSFRCNCCPPPFRCFQLVNIRFWKIGSKRRKKESVSVSSRPNGDTKMFEDKHQASVNSKKKRRIKGMS